MVDTQSPRTFEIPASARLEDCPASLQLAIREIIKQVRGTMKGRRNLGLESVAMNIAANYLGMDPTRTENHEAVIQKFPEGDAAQIIQDIHAELVRTGAYKPKKTSTIQPAPATVEPSAPVESPKPVEPPVSAEPPTPVIPPATVEPIIPATPPPVPSAPAESGRDPLTAIIQFRANIARRYSGSRTIPPAELDSIIIDALINEPPISAEKPEDTVTRLIQLLAQRLRLKASMLQVIAEDLAPEDQPDLSDIPPIEACNLEDLQRLEAELEAPRTKNSPKRTKAILETLSICYFKKGSKPKNPLKNPAKAILYTKLLLEFQAKYPDQNPEDLVIDVQRLDSAEHSLKDQKRTYQPPDQISPASRPAQAQEKYEFDPEKPIESYTTGAEAHLACIAIAATGDFQKGLELAEDLSSRFSDYHILTNHIIGFKTAMEILENPSTISSLRIREAYATSFILEYAGMITLAIQCLQKVIARNTYPEKEYANANRLKQLQGRLTTESQLNPAPQQPAAQSPETSLQPDYDEPQAGNHKPTATEPHPATDPQHTHPKPPQPAKAVSPPPEKTPDICSELLTWFDRLETTSRKWTKENGFLIIPNAQKIDELSGELERILTGGNTEKLYTDHFSTTGVDSLRGMIKTNLTQGIREGKVKIRLLDQITTALESLLPAA